MAALGAVLERVLGNESVPPAALGDLSDLLGTLEEGARLLRSLMDCGSDEEVLRLLRRIEILIEDDLPMIFEEEVVTMLLEDGDPELESEVVGVQAVECRVAKPFSKVQSPSGYVRGRQAWIQR